MFVNVAISISSTGPFTYGVPDGMEGQITVGKRVLVPFGRRRVTGYVIETVSLTELPSVKDIIDILDDAPLFNEEDLAFYRWTADYYLYPLGKTLKVALPGGIDIESNRWVRLAGDRPVNDDTLSDAQRLIMEVVTGYPHGLSIRKLKQVVKRTNLIPDVKRLESLRHIAVEDRLGKAPVGRRRETVVTARSPLPAGLKLTEKQKNIYEFLERNGETELSILRARFKNIRATVTRMEQKGLVSLSMREVYRSPAPLPRIGADTAEIRLNGEQEAALGQIARSMTAGGYFPCLLHGVTGSGKTEVYLRAIEQALLLGGSAIYLVPEITLTPQLLGRIRSRFDRDLIAILHSGVGRSAKYDEWRRIQSGEARIVIGARSAIFAPARNLRLLIVDEEHDPSYKQEDHLPYNARDLAVVRAKQQTIPVILGSATPAIQTYFNTRERDFILLELKKRVAGRELPRVDIIDMKKEKPSTLLSSPLIGAVAETLESGNQTLLFLNRRGFYTFLYCQDCGYLFKCLNCSVSMTHHMSDGSLRCHYCDFRVKAPPVCPICGGGRIGSYGVGTERIVEEIKRLFPGARVDRMDSDSTAARGAYGRILTAFDRGEIDILVGTQMITKGHDFPGVTLVGVVSADTSLNIPDFRAAEKTFQILTQVSGRGGRGDIPGRVIVQTVNPKNSTIQQARQHDYTGFYRDEVVLRRELGYPPFGRMVNLLVSSTNETAASECAVKLQTVAADVARQSGGSVAVLGPAEAPLYKVKGRYRWQLILKGTDRPTLHSLTRDVLSRGAAPGVRIKADVDPVNFM